METTLSFRIKGIEIIDFAMTAPTETVQVSQFNFDMQFRSLVNATEQMTTIFAEIVIKSEQNVQLGRYSAAFRFTIDEIDKILADKGAEIPQPLLSLLLGISVSTLRGLMFASFRGTFLHNAILPLVNMDALQTSMPL